MPVFSTARFFLPPSNQLRYLPEGPYPVGDNKVSWVSIEHGNGATNGSLNILDLVTRENQTFDLPERPGFAFPTNRCGEFVIGAGHEVALFNINTRQWKPFAKITAASNFIINDAVVIDEGLIFGCKDYNFEVSNAGLFLWRRRDQQLIQLRDDQTCSNGKVILQDGKRVSMLDIDTAAKSVVRRVVDVDAGTEVTNSQPELLFPKDGDNPDGMIATPDGNGVIIAFFNHLMDAEFGEARQYEINPTSSLDPHREPVAVWKVENAARVTCPQLVRMPDGVKLILTTAIEGKGNDDEILSRYPDAGCLFIGETSFNSLASSPVFNADGLPEA